MFVINEWMEGLKSKLLQEFGERLIYIGLQGSYKRGEAASGSDIDVMVVLDCLNIDDLQKYKGIISNLDMSEKACGFICGKEEINNWPRYEIFQLVHDTEDYYGALGSLVPEVSRDDIRDFVHINVANLYHEMCHRFIYSKHNYDLNKLYGAYKAAFYILQNIYYLEKGEFAGTKAELLKRLNGPDKEILERLVTWRDSAEDGNGNDSGKFEDYLNAMLKWSSRLVRIM